MILKHGLIHDEVKGLQDKLNRAGFHAGVVDGKFFKITDRAVRELQRKYNLTVDGKVGIGGRYGETMETLDELLHESSREIPTAAIDTFNEVADLPHGMPRNALDRRMSENIAMQQTADNQGARYGGWINPYMFDTDNFDEGEEFILPLVGRIDPDAPVEKPAHGGTCSPWAGLQLGWYLCANEDYNFRIGRSAYQIANFDHDEVYKNSTIPGYDDYCEVHGKRKLEKVPMNVLYERWEWLNKVNFVEMDHHCIIVLKVGGDDGLWLEDPHNPGQPLPPALYRWAADGYYPRKDTDGDGVKEKFYSGTKQTLRPIAETERCTQGWDIYRVDDVDPDTCAPIDGPWAGREPWPMVLEA